MRSIVITFSLLITCLLLLYRITQIQHFRQNLSAEWWVVLFSSVFFVLGLYFSREWFRRKKAIRRLDIQTPESGLSSRELEILSLVAEGFSNQQIADQLFVSEHTVKKHVSNVMLKLKAERRTEAVKIAKELKILPA